MESVLLYAGLLLLLELFELSWQKAETIEQMISKAYAVYKTNIFLFFAMHPGLYFVLFTALLSGSYNLWIFFLIGIKATDIVFKLRLMEKVFEQEPPSRELSELLRQRIPGYMYTVPVILYPVLLYFGLGG